MNSLTTNMLHSYKQGFRQKLTTTCGPASIILATQCLGLDAKQETDWSSQQYSKWMPVNDFINRGMALHELQCISELIYKNQIEVKLRRAFPENFSLFLEDIELFHRLQNSILIVNYRQDDFISTNFFCEYGNPHYSPIMNCSSSKKALLIADVDSAVKQPYWVKTEAMFKSMTNYNPAIGIPRGWLVLKKRELF